MLPALVRTITELLDSKKAAYSFVAALLAAILHVYFGVAVDQALLLVSPLIAGTVAQAHVDAAREKSTQTLQLPKLDGAQLAPVAGGDVLKPDFSDEQSTPKRT